MFSNKKRNTTFILFAVIVILAVFTIFYYFRAQKSKTGQDNIPNDSKEEIVQASELSRARGKEILDLLLILRQIKLDIGFFEDQNFRALKDFYQKIEILEEEKGNPNPFKKI